MIGNCKNTIKIIPGYFYKKIFLGHFGCVYRGRMNSQKGEIEVAIKTLKSLTGNYTTLHLYHQKLQPMNKAILLYFLCKIQAAIKKILCWLLGCVLHLTKQPYCPDCKMHSCISSYCMSLHCISSQCI